MKVKTFFFILLFASLFSACTPPAPAAEITPGVTASPTLLSSATPVPSATPTLLPTRPEATATPQPTAAAGHPPVLFGAPFFDTIALGEKASLVEGEAHFSFRIKGAFIGPKAASRLFKVQVPSGMQLVLVIPEMEYTSGPANSNVQLVHEDGFNIISKGHVLKNDFMQYTPVSNHLNNVSRLLPGETSQGYLVFAVYQDDDRPVLRYQSQGITTFFALTYPKPALETPQTQPDWFGDQNLGGADHPVPLGKTIAYAWNGNTLLMSVERVERGINANRVLWNSGGNPGKTPAGQENILPYLHIRLINSSADPVDIKPELFKIINQGQVNCPMPCLNNLSFYSNADASGWLPLVTASNDSRPVLSFNDELFFALADSSQAQKPAAAPVIFPAAAFGPDTIKSVTHQLDLQQHSVVHSLAFSPDNKWVVSGGDDHKIYIWDASTGKPMAVLAKHNAPVLSLAFSLDGKWLASASDDENVFVWSTADWSLMRQFNQGGRGIFAGFLADGSLVSVNQAGLISFWDVDNGTKTRQYPAQKNVVAACNGSRVFSFDMTADGSAFAAALDCGYGVVWDPTSNTRLVTDPNRAADAQATPYTGAIALSRVGGLAAYGSAYYYGIGFLVDISDLSRQLVLGGVGTATVNIPSIAFSPNAAIVAAAIGPTVRTWWPDGYNWTGRKSIDLKGHSAQVTALKFSNDATLLASGDYLGNIIIWKTTP